MAGIERGAPERVGQAAPGCLGDMEESEGAAHGGRVRRSGLQNGRDATGDCGFELRVGVCWYVAEVDDRR